MTVTVAGHAGFCFGVRRATETLEEALTMARETVGEGGTVTAIPNGISVIVLAE